MHSGIRRSLRHAPGGNALNHADTPIAKTVFAVVDVETTGLGARDRVIEVACVKLRGFHEITRFQSLVNPEIPVPAEATAINGIDTEMVSRAPAFPQIARALDALLEDAVFVAHNAPFDLGFLSSERKRCTLPTWKGQALDTLKMARNAIALPGYSLGALRKSLNLEHEPRHRALADVLATAALLARLVEILRPPPRTLEDLRRAQEPIRLSWEEDWQIDHAGLDRSLILSLAEAGREERAIAIEYEGRSGSHTYGIVPGCLERNGPLYYLQATLADSGEKRTFRVDRIKRVAPSPPADAQAADARPADAREVDSRD